MGEDSRIHSVLQRPNEISKRSPLNRTDVEVKVKSKKSLPAPGKQTPRGRARARVAWKLGVRLELEFASHAGNFPGLEFSPQGA